jgi:hypothetical protein
MSIQDFLTKLESSNERGSLFLALGRLRRLGNLRDLVQAATSDPAGSNGWVSWQDSDAESVDGAAIVGA